MLLVNSSMNLRMNSKTILIFLSYRFLSIQGQSISYHWRWAKLLADLTIFRKAFLWLRNLAQIQKISMVDHVIERLRLESKELNEPPRALTKIFQLHQNLISIDPGHTLSRDILPLSQEIALGHRLSQTSWIRKTIYRKNK